ncbi:unnamed protein product [Scytosiphon promiscuus]
MPPKMSRRGSIALNMLASMSLAPKLQSVLSSVNPPSEDAAFQIVDSVLTAAIWKSHLMTLDDIARECGARSMTLGLVRLLAMTNEYIARDEGEGGPNTTDLEGDEPIPCEIDARARGRVATLGWNLPQRSGDAMSDDVSNDDFLSCASSSAGSSNEKRGGYPPPLRNSSRDEALGKEAPETLAELPLARVLGIKTATGGNANINININSAANGKAMTARSEGVSTARSLASSAKLLLHPAMAGLFDMADRRRVGWLNIFLEYHGHKQWANPAFIRVTLVDLGISKGGNEPIKPHHFMRRAFLLFLMQKNPLMEFAARPLPPDQLSIGVPEQARELAGILKEVASRTKAKPVAARRRLNRQEHTKALTSQQLLKQPNLTPAAPGALVTGGSRDGGAAGGVVAEQWDLTVSRRLKLNQIAPQVSVRDLVVSRRPSTAPVVSRRQQQQHHELSRGSGKRVLPRDGGGGREKGDLLETFLHLDHSVQQASLIETVTDVRPGVVVQEMGFSSDGGGDASQTKGPGGTGNEPQQVVLRVKAGPAELQVPGRLSRSAYKALSRSRTAPEIPMGLDRPSMTSTAATDRGTAVGQAPQEIGGNSGLSHPLKSGVAGMRGGIRSSTAPLGLHGFFGVKDGPDPRLIGASKISAGYDGDEDNTNDGEGSH